MAFNHFDVFLPHFIPHSMNPQLIDFILGQESGVYQFLPTRAAYLYVFEEPYASQHQRPEFLQEDTWKEIEALREKYRRQPLRNVEQLSTLMNSSDIRELFQEEQENIERVESSLAPEIKEAFNDLKKAGGHDLRCVPGSLLAYGAAIEQRGREIKRGGE